MYLSEYKNHFQIVSPLLEFDGQPCALESYLVS